MKIRSLPYPERLAMAREYPIEGPLQIQIDTLVRIFGIRRENAEEITNNDDAT